MGCQGTPGIFTNIKTSLSAAKRLFFFDIGFAPSLSDSPPASLKSIMKRTDQLGPSDSPTTKKNLQFVGVNGG